MVLHLAWNVTGRCTVTKARWWVRIIAPVDYFGHTDVIRLFGVSEADYAFFKARYFGKQGYSFRAHQRPFASYDYGRINAY